MGFRPVLLIRNEFELQDLVDTLGRDAALVEKDFALMTIAAGLVAEYGDALCFKGGFILRHVHGHERFSKDIDATRINPPKHKLDSTDVAEVIRNAGMRNFLTLATGAPATDSGRSMDFDRVEYTGPLGSGFVSVEVSYREGVVEEPDLVEVGEPYYKQFPIPVMQLVEIVAEKLRTLAQRDRPTDLADLAKILMTESIYEPRVKELAAKKFELVKAGNHRVRIEETVTRLGGQYEAAVGAVAPDAPDYETAANIVLRKLPSLLP
ncbi:MAG TPA: nucleotidyl transferase AbiEii/AbiGii toxin family protein [Trueperaceae bacterium]|nr:nucleotidyl transferase AbiEii/AbiGii toxin family protein [Trueperaceae bacterium]